MRAFATWTAVLAALLPALASGATYYVDNSLLVCNNNGPGTEAQPYCTILAALMKRGGPGTTIIVKAGTYREQVTVPFSGTSIDPFVIQAQGTVNIDGADALDNPSWSLFGGNVWLAPGVTWQPVQVFTVDGRLTAGAGDPALLAPGSWVYVAGQGLYVNVGGGNPALRGTVVGHRFNGFHLTGMSYVTIDGFTVLRSEEKAIELEASADNNIIRNNNVVLSGSSGISLLSCSDNQISNNHLSSNWHHGIELRTGSSANTIEYNVSDHNQGSGVATGIYLSGSADNVIQRNRVHHNEDTGIELQSGSDNCVSALNVSYANGDHGFEHLSVSSTTNAGNVAWGNHTDGFSIEGTSPGTTLYDCIAANNGLGVHEYNLYVDPNSTAGFTSDYNIFWNATPQNPIRFGGVQYATVAAFATASGGDAQTLQADPQLVDPANGDFRPLPGSPAIDSGLSGFQFWPGFDAQGFLREDDPSTPNTGEGPQGFCDRGAYEYRSGTTGVGGQPQAAGIELSNAYPNPVRGSVAFALTLPREARVQWAVFDLQGRRLGGGESLRPAGRSLVVWNGAGATPQGGVRFARIVVDGVTFSRRFVALD